MTQIDPVMITGPEYVARLYLVLSSISNGQRRAWDQEMWMTVSPANREPVGGLDGYGYATATLADAIGPDALEWSCGSTGCLAGHLVVRHGDIRTLRYSPYSGHAHDYQDSGGERYSFMSGGAALIGLDVEISEHAAAAGELFSGENSLLRLWLVAEILTGGVVKVPADVVLDHCAAEPDPAEELRRMRVETRAQVVDDIGYCRRVDT